MKRCLVQPVALADGSAYRRRRAALAKASARQPGAVAESGSGDPNSALPSCQGSQLASGRFSKHSTRIGRIRRIDPV
jgi:hypothetical protein